MDKLKQTPNNRFYQFVFEGKTYECIGEDRDWQMKQFIFAIEDRQWVTVKNRITNQLKWGPNIKLVNKANPK
jgi:hypothetical protein